MLESPATKRTQENKFDRSRARAAVPRRVAAKDIERTVPSPKRTRNAAAVGTELAIVSGTITMTDAVPARPCVAPMANME